MKPLRLPKTGFTPGVCRALANSFGIDVAIHLLFRGVSMRYPCTTGGHFTLAKRGSDWYYVPTDRDHPAKPVGPFEDQDEALEAAQHLENEYFRTSKPPSK